MPVDSIALSLLFFGSLLLEVRLFGQPDLAFLQRGRHIRISKTMVGLLLATTSLIGFSLAYLAVYQTGPANLQTFYLIVFGLLWVANGVFFLNISSLRQRIGLATVTSLSVIILALEYPHPIVQNIVMVGSLLWVGPVIAKLARRLTPMLVGLGVSLFALLDAYNLTHTHLVFSDKDLRLNGLVTVGDFYLGIGDFLLAFLVMAFTERFFGRRPAIILAIIFPLPRLFIRMIAPSLAGLAIPYSIFLALPTLVLFGLQGLRSRPNQTSVS